MRAHEGQAAASCLCRWLRRCARCLWWFVIQHHLDCRRQQRIVEQPGRVAVGVSGLQPQLQLIVLQPADLSAGWKGTPYQPDPSEAADQAAFAKCVGVRSTDADKAEANSDDFARGDATVSSSATSFRSQSDVDADVAALHSPKLSTCEERC